MIRRIKETAGFVMPMVLAVIVAMTIIFAAVAQLVTSNISLVSNNIKSQKALNIAEAGINYYLWHLSHNATDFRDGKTTPASPDPQLGYGPYVHNYVDDNTDVTGTYTLWISPQGNGSSIMKVRSIGKVSGTNFTRTVEAQIGAPSFASYAVVSDNALWFGANEQANGPVHSNQGVRMDGQSTGEVSSARATYTPSVSVGGDGSSHPGVWCSPSVVTPINCNTRPKDTWIYPTTSIDYNQVSNSLCTMKKVAFGG
jgi:Tfp pilus assembly protein PilX